MGEDVGSARSESIAIRKLFAQAARCREHLIIALASAADPRTERAILTAIRRQTEMLMIIRQAIDFHEAREQISAAAVLTANRYLT
jgi:hypothetical protein